MLSSICVIPSPLGSLGITLVGKKLAHVKIIGADKALPTFSENTPPADFVPILNWLNQYFSDPFSVSIKSLNFEVKGTDFQRQVWQMLVNIPVGKTITYGELAKKLQTSPRAVGAACRTNPIPIIVPCHRVVAKNGLGGFMGETAGGIVGYKSWLLSHESKKGV